MTKIENFWKRFKKNCNLQDEITYNDVYYFDFDKKSANKLLNLVRKEKKQATTSLYIPEEFSTKIGEYNIITTFKNTPKAVIQITNFIIMPFKEMTFELAVLEGEDKVFETWKNNHIAFLSQDAKNHNISFDENTMIVFETFKLVYKE